VGQAIDFSQEELIDWMNLPPTERRRMSAEDIKHWRQRRKSEPGGPG